MKKITTSLLILFLLFATNIGVNAQNIIALTPSSTSANCNGTATVNPSLIGTSWFWYQGTTILQTGGTVVDSLCPGSYELHYLDLNSTNVILPFTIALNNPCAGVVIQAGLTPTSVAGCTGNITVSNPTGGLAPYTYALPGSTPTTNSVFSNLCDGTYTINVTDANGCNAVITTVVGSANPCANSTLQVGFVPTPISAVGSCDGTITVNASGGLTPYSYALSGGTNPNANVFNNLCANSYTLVVTDAQGCTSNSTIIIQLGTPNPCATLAATINSVNATTPNSCDGIVHVIATGGTAPYMFSGDMGVTFVNVNTFPNMCVGGHAFMVKDQAGCSVTINGMVNVDSTNIPCLNSNLSVVLNETNATTATNCDGTLTAVVSGASAGYTYEWSNTLGNTSLNLINLCPGMYSISVHDGACTVIMNRMVQINSTATGCAGSTLTGIISSINATNAASCNGSIIISGNGGTAPYQYSVDNGTTIVSTPNFTGLCAGQYYLGMEDAAGCVLHFIHYVGIDSISTSNPCANSNLSVALIPTPVTSPTSCDGTVTAMVSGGIAPITPFWSAGSNTSANTLSLTNLCSDVYTLYVVDGNGCSMTSTVYVGGYIDSTVAANMGINGYVLPVGVSGDGFCDGNASVIVYGGAQPFTYLYSNGATTQSAVGLCAGLQNVVVTDNNGASVSFDFIIGSPVNMSGTNNFIDSTLIDSVYTNPIIDCIVNFAMIDSAYIIGFNILPNDSVVVTWGVVFNDSLVTVVNTYGLTIGGATAATGVYMITLQLYCPNKTVGNFLSATDQIYYSQATMGIAENGKESNNVSVYPIPFTDQITISLEKDETSQVVITDITGKVIVDKKFNNQIIKIDMNGLSAGQYIVNVKSNSTNYTRKIVK